MHEELIARVEYLETRIAFQDHTIEQLSLELATQQKQQEKLRLQLDAVIAKLRRRQLVDCQPSRRDATASLLRSTGLFTLPEATALKKSAKPSFAVFLYRQNSTLVNFRVEHIAQPIPQQVDDQHQHHQTQTREGGDPPGAGEHVVEADADE